MYVRAACSYAYLFAIHNVPLLCLAITVQDISGMQVPVLIPGLGICFGVVMVCPYDRRAAHTCFTSDIECGDIFAILVDQPAFCQS